MASRDMLSALRSRCIYLARARGVKMIVLSTPPAMLPVQISTVHPTYTREQADGQLAWLERGGHVAAVLTIDSDLLVHGCNVLTRLNFWSGWADYYSRDAIM